MQFLQIRSRKSFYSGADSFQSGIILGVPTIAIPTRFLKSVSSCFPFTALWFVMLVIHIIIAGGLLYYILVFRIVVD